MLPDNVIHHTLCKGECQRDEEQQVKAGHGICSPNTQGGCHGKRQYMDGKNTHID